MEKRGSNYQNESTARIFISAVAMETNLVLLLAMEPQLNTMERRDFHRRRKEGRELPGNMEETLVAHL